ncbi:MAG: 23S rRNA (pseudouridine(1915)-N(3))-methyltransferase RlmH [Bacteroidales bacterium]|nr:23S rRNA (pseudouridine(1915)-N(3))-methyltransferase RlmH [Bacteroidales bacterium]
MKIVLLQTGKTTERYIAEGMEIFSARIKKYTRFEILTVPDVKNSRSMTVFEQKDKEGKKILRSVTKDDYLVLLDERGKEFRTFELAEWLEKRLMLPGKRIVFIIGGPWGFSEEVCSSADFRLSLSRMTFPHQMVRLLFLEQLYRAFTIIKGEPYHHE